MRFNQDPSGATLNTRSDPGRDLSYHVSLVAILRVTVWLYLIRSVLVVDSQQVLKYRISITQSASEKEAPKGADRTTEGVVTKVDHITSYTDDAKVLSTRQPDIQKGMLRGNDPYPPGEVSHALTRSYQIAQFDVTAVTTSGTIVFTGRYPFDMLSVPYIFDKLKYYTLFRAKQKITLRINSTKFDYGSLLIAHLPYFEPQTDSVSATNGFRLENIYSAAQCNATLLSIQQGASVDIEMPWINPKPWMDLDSAAAEIGTLRVFVLHPLSSVGKDPPTKITVTVFGQFVAPEVAGYAPDVTPLPMAAKPQAYLRSLKKRQDGVSQMSTVNKEAEKKTSSGLITGILEAAETFAPIIGGVCPEVGELFVVGKALSPIFGALGLDKPANPAVTQPVYLDSNANGALCYGSGLDPSRKLSLKPDNLISVARGICGDEDPQPRLLDAMKRPGLIAIGAFNNITNPGDQIWGCPVHACYAPIISSYVAGDLYQPTPMGYYTGFCAEWRGSIKYMIRFTTSSFVTTRVRISHLLDALTTSTYAEVSGDLVSKVVDVTGDTMVTFTIPWISRFTYLPVVEPWTAVGAYNLGLLTVTLVTPVASVDETNNPPVYYDIWAAAGDDFRLMRQLVPIVAPTDYLTVMPEPDPESQCSPLTEFKKPFQGLIPARYSMEAAIVNGEDFGTINTMCHRYQYMRQASSTTIPSTTVGTIETDVSTESNAALRTGVLNLLIAPFLFWRGARRIAIVPSTDSLTITPYSHRITEGHMGNGALMTFSTDKKILYVEVPWFTSELFYETVPTMSVQYPKAIQYENLSTQAYKCYFSIGDDFSLGTMAACPMIWHVSALTDAQPEKGRPRNKGGRQKRQPYPPNIRLALKEEYPLLPLVSTPSVKWGESSAPAAVRKTGS